MEFIETVIIGGGFSGLFFCDRLNANGYRSFTLIEQNKDRLGWFAILGGIKIGLLPAGEKTRKVLPPGSYEYFSKEFPRRFGMFLRRNSRVPIDIDFASVGLVNKLYDSYILTKANARNLVFELQKKIKEHILYELVDNISHDSDGFEVHLNNDKSIKCRYLVIASGRYFAIQSLMEQLGQRFSKVNDFLFGCRACFNAMNTERIFKHQPDFKVKDVNCYQTYCFNYKGNINLYKYNDKRIYSGSLNEKRSIGNCFIGRRVLSTPEAVLSMFEKPIKVNYNDFLQGNWPDSLKDDFHGIAHFMNKLSKLLKIEFVHLHFPALEQFWPKPAINAMSLESNNLANVFYIGDASGISYGILQCYVTSNILIGELAKRHVFQ